MNNNQYFEFEPKTLSVNSTQVSTTSSFSFRIRNTCSQKLMVYDIFLPSKEFFIRDFSSITLQQNETYEFMIYYCPKKAGRFQTNILFQTSKGNAFFPIVHNAFSHQIQTPDGDLKYLCSQNSTLSFEIPYMAAHNKNKATVIYDKNIFTPINDETSPLFKLSVNPKLKKGSYITFVHTLFLNNLKTFTVFFVNVQKSLQSISPVISLSTVTDKEKQVYDVYIVNPTNKNYSLISAYLSKSSIYNIEYVEDFNDVMLEEQSKALIGHFVVYGSSREGSFETSLVLNYIPTSDYEYYKHRILPYSIITVKYRVYHGSLDMNTPEIIVIPNGPKIFNINFINSFNEDVLITRISLNTTMYSISPITEFLVKPGTKSQNITITVPNIEKYFLSQSYITIETNVTSIKIPIFMYDGQLLLSKYEDSIGDSNTLTFHYGEKLCQSTDKVSFFLYNPNPVPFKIESIQSTPGISTKNYINEIQPSLIGIEIPPFNRGLLTITIKYKSISSYASTKTKHPGAENEDTVIFYGSNISCSFKLFWIPVEGDISISLNFDGPFLIGKRYYSHFLINSTYNKILYFTNAIPVSKGIRLDPIQFVNLENRSTYDVGDVFFEVNQEMFSDTHCAPLLDPESHYYAMFEQWTNVFDRCLPAKMHFLIYLNSTILFHKTIKYELIYSIYPDTNYDIGYVSTDTTYELMIPLYNPLDSPLRFVFHNPSLYSFKNTNKMELILQSEESDTMILYFSESTEKNLLLNIPIMSNATAPFFVTFNISLTKPKLSLIDKNNLTVDDISFSSPNDYQYIGKTWNQSFKLINNGLSYIENISLYLNNTNDSLKYNTFLHFTLNCLNLLPEEFCWVNISFEISRFPIRSTELFLIFNSGNYNLVTHFEISIAEDTLNAIKRPKQAFFLCISILGFLYPTYFVLAKFWIFIKNRKIIRYKKQKSRDTIKQLSYRTIGIQCIDSQDKFAGGSFMYCENPHPIISADALSYLATISYKTQRN